MMIEVDDNLLTTREIDWGIFNGYDKLFGISLFFLTIIKFIFLDFMTILRQS